LSLACSPAGETEDEERPYQRWTVHSLPGSALRSNVTKGGDTTFTDNIGGETDRRSPVPTTYAIGPGLLRGRFLTISAKITF